MAPALKCILVYTWYEVALLLADIDDETRANAGALDREVHLSLIPASYAGNPKMLGNRGLIPRLTARRLP